MPLLRTVEPGARLTRLLVLAAVTGAITGLGVFAFETLTQSVLLDRLLESAVPVQVLAPAFGLVASALLLRYAAFGASNATSDEYIRAFHERSARLPLREMPGKLLAGVATIGMGGALGIEGPSVYTGSAVGLNLKTVLHRFVSPQEAKVLLTAGAAAGVAAAFKTPATGVLFALEAPYRDDVAHRALLPALVAAASGYLTLVTLEGTTPVIGPLGSRPELDARALGGAVIVGLVAGLIGRSMAWLIHRAKALPARWSISSRIAGAAVALGLLTAGSQVLFDSSLTLGPGYGAIAWATDPLRIDEPGGAMGLIALLLVMRVAATVGTVGASGTGGLFIPLATQGVLVGRLIAGGLGDPSSGLFPVIGLAAVLGAAYRAPLAGVMFVAETQRGAVYIIPALVAAAVSQMVVGRWSVSAFQRDLRQGHLEHRFTMPISAALDTDVLTVPPDATVAEFVMVHAMGRRRRVVPVVDGERYLGLCSLDELSDLDREEWDRCTVADVMRTDLPVGLPTWTIRDAVAAMEASNLEVLPVCDRAGLFVGIVEQSEIVKLDEILRDTER